VSGGKLGMPVGMRQLRPYSLMRAAPVAVHPMAGEARQRRPATGLAVSVGLISTLAATGPAVQVRPAS